MTIHGFHHLNTDSVWPSFPATPEHALEIGSDGALRLVTQGDGRARRGVFRAGPFQAQAGWFRLRALADLQPQTHLQLFTASGAAEPAYDPEADEPFLSIDGWQAAPRDELDVLVSDEEANELWVGAILRGDGFATPVLHQMRADYGRRTNLRFLPAVYGREDGPRDFLQRFLSLQESVLGDVEHKITELPRLFDPASSPAESSGGQTSWLGWLADWLAFDLAETWSEGEKRENLAEAFELYGRRGTIEGLRAFLKAYAGVEARIEEPANQRSIWMLGSSRLGFSTQLAAASAQGAVLDSTATLDASHLIRQEDFGAPLFLDDAHRFRVSVYASELAPAGARARVETILEREKPAHTQYHLSVIEPLLRVGVQARVGIDAIVASPPVARLGERLGIHRLAAEAEPCDDGPILATPCLPCSDELSENELPQEDA